jgi:hypothetical protein
VNCRFAARVRVRGGLMWGRKPSPTARSVLYRLANSSDGKRVANKLIVTQTTGAAGRHTFNARGAVRRSTDLFVRDTLTDPAALDLL